jgi:mono/diheme cytochrome c family protein
MVSPSSAVVFRQFLLEVNANMIVESESRMNKLGFFAAVMFAALLLNGVEGWAQNPAEGRKLYASYCVSCHGEKGKGDGAAAKSLPAKPADHTNGTVMNQHDDKYLTEIIAKGGSSVGKSSFMPPWGSALDEKQIRDLVAFIRTLAAPPYKGSLPARK